MMSRRCSAPAPVLNTQRASLPRPLHCRAAPVRASGLYHPRVGDSNQHRDDDAGLRGGEEGLGCQRVLVREARGRRCCPRSDDAREQRASRGQWHRELSLPAAPHGLSLRSRYDVAFVFQGATARQVLHPPAPHATVTHGRVKVFVSRAARALRLLYCPGGASPGLVHRRVYSLSERTVMKTHT